MGSPFRELWKALETEDVAELEGVRAQLNAAMLQFTQDSGLLNKFEIESTRAQLEQLEKELTRKLSVLQPRRKFKFSKRPQRDTASDMRVPVAISKVEMARTDLEKKNCIINEPVTEINNIRDSIIEPVPHASGKVSKSGSINLNNMENNLVKLDNLPFQIGNIVINNCQKCIFAINLPSKNKIQIRLHNIIESKFVFHIAEQSSTSDGNKQVIVIENLQNCIFDSKSAPSLQIHSFNKPLDSSSTSTTDDTSVTFQDLSLDISGQGSGFQ